MPALPRSSAGFFQAPHKHGHLFFRLAVALGARGFDAAPVGLDRLVGASELGQRSPERFPRRRLQRIALHRVLQVLRGACMVARLGVFEAERVA